MDDRFVFRGPYDPFHNGHLEVVERASRHFDRVVVAVLRNTQKSEQLFSAAEREEMLGLCVVRSLSNVSITSMSTLVVDVAHLVGADVIVKGLRAVSDFENEFQMAQMNEQLSGIETLMIPTGSSHSFISSRLIREIARLGGDVSPFVPAPIAIRIQERIDE